VVTLNALRKELEARLRKRGIEEAELDACLLISHVVPVTEIDFAINRTLEITSQQLKAIEALVHKRENRIPMSQIFGQKEFWSLNFQVTKDTLTPRPDSETLIEVSLKEIADKEAPLLILDLGTGSGCLLLTLLSELKGSSGFGVDISVQALEVASTNATNLNLDNRAKFINSNWFENLSENDQFDIIISNPPYIGLEEKPDLSPEVIENEPHRALFSGEKGLDDYKKIAAGISHFMNEEAFIILEIGYKQAASVRDIFSEAGFKKIHIFQDLGGRDRCLLIRP
jgi:release factor glutamine methyltransferase